MVERQSKEITLSKKGYVEFFIKRNATENVVDFLKEIVFEALDSIYNHFDNYETDLEDIQKDRFGTYCRYNFSIKEDAEIIITHDVSGWEPDDAEIIPYIEDDKDENFITEVKNLILTSGDEDISIEDVIIFDMEAI